MIGLSYQNLKIDQIKKPKVEIDEGSYCLAGSQEMSAVKTTHNAKQAKGQGSLLLGAGDTQSEESEIGDMKTIMEEDPSIFLLNNLLMSVQFFENYEREVELLRENWFKEVSLESHHKKCFYADSLFRLCEKNIKFQPRHGPNKNSEVLLHPYRIYISSDNIEAAFDPSVLGRNKLNLWPQYQLTVRTNEDIEKSGYISLVEFKTLEAPIRSPKTNTPKHNFVFHDATNPEKTEYNTTHFQRKSAFEEKYNRRLTKTEKLINAQNWKANQKMIEKRNSVQYFTLPTENNNSFYKYIKPEAKLTPIAIKNFRMNSLLANSHEIPQECFQREEIIQKLDPRRMLNECFRSQNVLNSAAFKGYFCDLLIDKLPDCLSLNPNSVDDSSILEEFIIVKQNEVQQWLTPVITIKDWNNFVVINKNFQDTKTKQLAWPSDQMQKIMSILPCYAVPTGCFDTTKDNVSYEKTWKLVFPKAEEFFILHMMHAHIRCYYFVLLLYKSFIETEINSASLGPKHLLHLLFWRVHKNFLAWPEDRPGETLLSYLKILYKKLQNKSLSDFFITSRNLFADSQLKDLHKAQVLVKKIIENPVPYVMSAIRNLNLDTNFYPGFDVLKLNTVLTAENIVEKIRKTKKQKKQKSVTFQDDQEQHWRKMAMKQIRLERKAEEEEQARKESIESINLEKTLDMNTEDFDKCNQILGIFTSHFIDLGYKSIEYNFLSQAFFYLNQAQNLFELNVEKGMEQRDSGATDQKIKQLKEACFRKLNRDVKPSPVGKVLQEDSNITEGEAKNVQRKATRELEKLKETKVKQQVQENDIGSFNEGEIISIKL